MHETTSSPTKWTTPASLALSSFLMSLSTIDSSPSFSWWINSLSLPNNNSSKRSLFLCMRSLYLMYIVYYFQREKKQAWISLGGAVLSKTGSEALFADVGHFSIRSIQLSMCSATYPALLLAYAGQASFLRENNQYASDVFFKSLPHGVYWPMFVLAVLAAIIASQAMISGTFSMIQQSIPLGCFPPVEIVHTSYKHHGQVYIPVVNYLLMLACIAVTLGFRTTQKIGDAYGIAVVFVMTLTSLFLILVMVLIWKCHILVLIAYGVVIGVIELIYLSSVLYKFEQGGYLPLVFAMLLISVMYVWNYVYTHKYNSEQSHSISLDNVAQIMAKTNSIRLPGLAIFHLDMAHGIPPIFQHYISNVPAMHSVLILVSFKRLPVGNIPLQKRFFFARIQPSNMSVFHCVVQCGYTDHMHKEADGFEGLLLRRLKEFIHHEKEVDESIVERDVGTLDRACDAGVVHLVGEEEVASSIGSSIARKIIINYAYHFLHRNLMRRDEVYIPHKRTVKIGMIYEI